MYQIFAIVMSVGPCLGLMLFLARPSARRPDRARAVVRVFIGGVAVTVLALLGQVSLTRLTAAWTLPVLARTAFDGYIAAALVEESLKLMILLRLVFARAEFREVNDGIIYAIAAGLGFCCLENILYAGDAVIVSINRACTAVPLHALASGLMGYEIGLAKLRPRAKRHVWHGLWKAVLIHGTYNFILMSVTAGAFATTAAFLIVPLLAIAYIWLTSEARLAREKDKAQTSVAPRHRERLEVRG